MPFVWFFARVPFMTICWPYDSYDSTWPLRVTSEIWDSTWNGIWASPMMRSPSSELILTSDLSWRLLDGRGWPGPSAQCHRYQWWIQWILWFSQCLGGWTSWTSIGRLALRKKTWCHLCDSALVRCCENARPWSTMRFCVSSSMFFELLCAQGSWTMPSTRGGNLSHPNEAKHQVKDSEGR